MNNSEPYEIITISVHPAVRKWLMELACDNYDNNVSAAVTGLTAYDRGIKRAKELRGEKHSHHVTAGIVNRRETLEAAIREIESTDPGFNARTWLEIQRQKSAEEAGPA